MEKHIEDRSEQHETVIMQIGEVAVMSRPSISCATSST